MRHPASVGAIAALVATFALGAPSRARSFDLDDVAERARSLAAKPYQAPKADVPRWLLDLDYDRWRQIRFRPEHALWRERDLPFQVQLFHPGLYYDRTVRIHVVDGEGVHPVSFSPDRFEYPDADVASRVPQDLGYAGFRLHAPFKTADYHDEVAVFLGASYFRAVGRDDVFGLSARGLALDTALPSGEEFPWFRAFWLVRPAPGATDIAVYALLDSPSLTGAYRFAVTPGEETRVQVESRIYRREAVEKLGVAPLTSMFLYGETRPRPFEDFRPEVHDSDGLAVALASGEWIWRPLANPERLRVTRLDAPDPKGFGLAQRDRDWDHYQDLEARAERRPGLWIEPRGDWGAGHVELVEIPSDQETNDNVVAYWVPAETPPVGEPLTYAYDMRWSSAGVPPDPPAGRVVATRRDAGGEGAIRWTVDFEGPQLRKLGAENVLRGVVSAGPETASVEILEQRVQKNPVTGGWRLVFQVRARDAPVELRAFLQKGDEILTETWTTRMAP